jgi:hypothetical protein
MNTRFDYLDGSMGDATTELLVDQAVPHVLA